MPTDRKSKLALAANKREREFLAITAYETVIQTGTERVAAQPRESFGSTSTNIQNTSD
ncbi:5054_t:CDS:1, partial [Dentiscutata erythropus]